MEDTHASMLQYLPRGTYLSMHMNNQRLMLRDILTLEEKDGQEKREDMAVVRVGRYSQVKNTKMKPETV